MTTSENNHRPIVRLDSGYHNLEDYGFNCLTGEACVYSMRLLFDVSEKGADLFKTFLGIPRDSELTSNWNNFVGTEPSVASVMMTRSTVEDLTKFILFHVEKCQFIYYHVTGQWYGSMVELPYCREDTGWTVWRNCNPHYAPSVDGRNTHQMSGRSI